MPLVRLHRLLAALGRAVPPHAVQLMEQADRQTEVLLVRMLVLIANVWGAAWKGQPWPPANVVHELTPALLLHEHSLQKEAHPSNWYLFRAISTRYFQLVIDAAAAHGRAAALLLGEWLEARWHADGTRRFWPAEKQRNIALALFRRDGARDRLVSRLEVIQTRMQDTWHNAHEQIEEYVAQARAWAEAGEPRRAERLLPEVLNGSFGIHHDKDTQLGHWVDWFRRILNDLPELARPDIARFAAGVGNAAAARRGYGSTQAAMDFLSAVARFNPTMGEQLRHWFLTENALEFLPGVESLCLAALRDAEADPAIALATVRRICLPYQERSNVELAKALAARLLTLEGRAKARRFCREILAAIETDCAGPERRPWWEAFAEVEGTGTDDRLLQPFRDKLVAAGLKPLDHTPGSVTLTDGEVIEEPDLQQRLAGPDDLVAVLSRLAEDQFHGWGSIIGQFGPQLDEATALRLLDAVKHAGSRASDVTPIIERLRQVGRVDVAEQEARDALTRSEPVGWLRYWGGGSRILPYRTLVCIDDNYASQALSDFVNDYLSEVRNPREFVRELDDVVTVFWRDPPLADLWHEIREHVFQLNEFARSDQSQLEALVSDAPGQRTIPQVLVGVLVDAYRQPLPEFREDAYKGLVWLAGCSSDAAALVAEEVHGLFHRGGELSLLGLSLLEGLAEVLPASIESFRSELSDLSRSPDAAQRMSALGLIDELGIPPLDIPAGRRRLPLTYRMDLPEFA